MSGEAAEAPKLLFSSTEQDKGLRAVRTIFRGITDYLTDDVSLSHGERVDYYSKLHSDLGITLIRSEMRMDDMKEGTTSNISKEHISPEQIKSTYIDSLKAMKEAGIKDVAIVLFTPSERQKDLLQNNFDEFKNEYAKHTKEVLDCCLQAGVKPAYLQVMNEVNMSFQTEAKLSQIVDLVKLTKQMTKDAGIYPDTKVMTSIAVMSTTNQKNSMIDTLSDFALRKSSPRLFEWQNDIKTLIEGCGDSLDSLGVDYYPGTYTRQAFSFGKQELTKSRPFETFGDTSPYDYIFSQKKDGFLKHTELIITETGVPTMSKDSRWGQLGMGRILQALDMELLKFQKQELSTKNMDIHELESNSLLRGFIAFTGGNSEEVKTKVPRMNMFGQKQFAVDFTPWTFMRKNVDGAWEMTETAKRFGQMCDSKFPNPK
jgi:hypothetical protein